MYGLSWRIGRELGIDPTYLLVLFGRHTLHHRPPELVPEKTSARYVSFFRFTVYKEVDFKCRYTFVKFSEAANFLSHWLRVGLIRCLLTLFS